MPARQLASLGIALALFPRSLWTEPRSLRVTRLTAPLPGLAAPLRVVAIGDLQPWRHHWPARRLREAFDRARAERPDLVLWLGDYYNHPTKTLGRLLDRAPPLRRLYHRLQTPMADIAAEMGRLTAPMGAYAILGNHDWGWSGEAVAASLRAQGIIPLIGEATEAAHPATGARLRVVGLDDASSGRPHGWGRLRAEAREPCVLLTHAPDIWDELEGPPALTLAGHTHAGQIAPWPIGPTRLPELGERHVSGWARRGGARLYVTAGVGCSGPPMRLGAPPEILSISLQPA